MSRVRIVSLVAVLLLGCPAAEQRSDRPVCAPSVEASAALAVPVGQRGTLTVTFRNPTAVALNVSGLVAPAEFIPPSVAQTVPSGTCEAPGVLELPIVFAPAALGARSGRLDGQFGEGPFSLLLRGSGTGPQLETNDVSLGIVAVGESVTASMVLRNTGSAGTALVVDGLSVTEPNGLCVGRWSAPNCEMPTSFTVERQVAVPLRFQATTPGPHEWQVRLRSSEHGRPERRIRISAYVLDTRGCQLASNPARVELIPPRAAKTIQLENRGTTECLIEGVATKIGSIQLATVIPQRHRLRPGARLALNLVGQLRDIDAKLEGELEVRLLPPASLIVPLRFEVGAVPSCLTFDQAELGSWAEGCAFQRSFSVRNRCGLPVIVQRVSASGAFEVRQGTGVYAAGERRFLPLGPRAGAVVGQLLERVEFSGVGGTATARVTGRVVERRLRTETFQFDVAPKIDVLFVLDDSPSFAPHQARTVVAIEEFGQRVARGFLNFRVGVTSGSRTPLAGRLRSLPSGERWASSTEANFTSRVVQLASQSSQGSEDESCLEAAIRARTSPLIDDDAGTRGFWRPGVSSQIICVTDADENTPDLDAGIARLRETADGGQVSYVVVSGQPESTCAVESAGISHQVAMRAINGYAFDGADVCDPSWWSSFFGIGALGEGGRTSFFLMAAPDGPMTVSFDGTPLPAVRADGVKLWSYSSATNAVTVDRSLIDGEPHTLAVTFRPTCGW